MPAAAVIPAPIAYIKVVAVKKLVVGFLVDDVWVQPRCCTDRSLVKICHKSYDRFIVVL